MKTTNDDTTKQAQFTSEEIRDARIAVRTVIYNMKGLLTHLAIVEGSLGEHVTVNGRYETVTRLPGTQETHDALDSLRRLKGALNEDLHNSTPKF